MPKPGSVIGGKYRLRRRVGEGAMASVWSAVHETIGRPVAVKFIHARGPSAQVTVARFMQEARIAAAVQHRFVVDIFDFGQTEEGEPYMVMELLQGESLADRITRGPPIPLKTFVRVMAQALSGLDAVHKAGIVHRDLKPENIFLMHDSDGGFPKLLDFGISRVEESLIGEKADRLTKEGTLLGTPWYMSPEQVRGRAVDGRSDLYSIAVIMYEALTGQLPFDAEAVGDLLVKIATADPIPVHALRKDLPRELSDVISKAMAKDAHDRYDSALSMRIALQALDDTLRDDSFTVVIQRADSAPPMALGSDELHPASVSHPMDAPRLPSGVHPTMDEIPEAPSRRPGLVLAGVLAVVAVGVVAFVVATDDGEQSADEPAPADVAAAPRVEPERAPEAIVDAGSIAAPIAHEAAPAPEPAEPAAVDRTERPRVGRARRTAQRRSARATMMAATPESFRDPGF